MVSARSILRLVLVIGLGMATSITAAMPAWAVVGELGFFGGISSGTRLPKTTEILLRQEANNRGNTRNVDPMTYVEMVFLDGQPRVFEGIITPTLRYIPDDSRLGTFSDTYVIGPSDTSPEDVSIVRNIAFDVNFRVEGSQVVRDYQVATWAETITTPGGTFVLDARQSQFTVSIIEDIRAGVTFYRGDVSIRAFYREAESGDVVIDDRAGSFYGFRSAWSATETHRIDSTITAPGWQMQVQMRPSVSVSKFLQYTQNEPTAISFAGNFREVMQNVSAMEWNIFHRPHQFSEFDDSGRVVIPTFNTFEQLISPNLNFLRGHPAEFDISRLFAMQILNGDPRFFRPEQAITRGQFTAALSRALKLQITPTIQNPRGRRQNVVTLVFPDVPEDRPEFPYIMAAREFGLAMGRDDGRFHIDAPLDRQEAIALMIRAIGLEDIGIHPVPTTIFTDDHLISPWARRELYVAEWIGLVTGDANGNVRPTDFITNAEAAAMINRLIEYMRFDLALDYTDHIVNFAG